MTEPLELDLDAITAAESEAAGEPHKVTWGGQAFLVPRINDWPLEVFDLLGRGELTNAVATILGDEWEPFHKAKHPTYGAADALLNGIAQREGFSSLGESLASSPTSNRAMRRSKPTSSGTTR